MSGEKEGNIRTSDSNDGNDNADTEAYTTARLLGMPIVKCKLLTSSPRDRPLADIVSRTRRTQIMMDIQHLSYLETVSLGYCVW
jgi:hypothetical protein